nr:hypothetical protein [Maliibacterium massiliense]
MRTKEDLRAFDNDMAPAGFTKGALMRAMHTKKAPPRRGFTARFILPAPF